MGLSFKVMILGEIFNVRVEKKVPKNYKNTIARKPRIGKGAVVDILARCLHPSEHIRNKYVNFEAQKAHFKLVGCTVLSQARKTISRKEQLAVVVSHPDFPDVELYAVKR